MVNRNNRLLEKWRSMSTKDMLAGIKVVDITNNLAGPCTAAMLADYGAEVIHIEKPLLGDDARAYPPKMDGVSLAAGWINRGKKSVVLDVKDPKGKELLKKMIADADVLVESNRPGVMERLGLDYESVKQIKPDIVYCSLSAFGQTGPYAKNAGYDLIGQAYSGIMHMTGYRDDVPMKSGFAIGDMVGALNAFGSIMTALFHRNNTGIGQHVDISLARGLLWANTQFERVNVGMEGIRNGNHDPSLSPYGLYEGNHGQSVIIAALSVNLWTKLCKLMGREDMINDPRYADISSRAENQAEVIVVINDWLQSFDQIEEAIAALNQEGIPNIKVNANEDIAKDPHAIENKWILDVPVEDSITSQKSYLTRNVVATFSETPGTIKKGPTLGQHNHEILTRYGMTLAEIDKLQKRWQAEKQQALDAAANA